MGEPSLGTPPSERPPEDRLDSWKEIAAYLNRDVTTVQRWEKREGMPVHRHLHDRMGSVYASRAELDAWARSRNLRAAQENGNNASSPILLPSRCRRRCRTSRTRWRVPLLLAAVAVVALAIGVRPLAAEHGVLLAKPHRRRAISDSHGLRWSGAGRCGFTRRSFRGVSVGPGRADGRLGHAGRFGTVPQLDPRQPLRNSSIRRSAPWGSRPTALSVTFWVRKQDGSSGGDISIWAVPTLGGQPRPYLEGVAEFDWSHDGSRLAYHTPGPGDPLFVSDGSRRSGGQPIFTAPAGLHTHFPLWAPDADIHLLRPGLTSGQIGYLAHPLQPAELLNGSRRTMRA